MAAKVKTKSKPVAKKLKPVAAAKPFKLVQPEKSAPKKSKGEKVSDGDEATARDVIGKVRKSAKQITTSSTAEYFAKNLQQVGFSSPTKAVLTTLKEALDNALDACEDAGILPDIKVKVHKLGAGTLKNTDQVLIKVTDNGPGIAPDDIAMVFGEYLASSKFGRGRCSRGQQGIGISAATTWAMQTTATGAKVVTKQKNMKKALQCVIDMDLKNNKGVLRDKQSIDWNQDHGTSVEFVLDGRIMVNGEAGLLNYLRGTILLNPHMALSYDITDVKPTKVARVTDKCPEVPEATEPHPHTMKLGEFISHARLFGRMKTSAWLKKGFSRISDRTMDELVSEQKLDRAIFSQNIDTMPDDNFKKLFAALQNAKLMAPSTSSVLAIGEDGLALSIRRLGDVDFFAVSSRKPMIADFKPVQVEVAIARIRNREGEDSENAVQVLRFANRVPLQFDKAACAIVKAINSVTWRSYGLRQPKDSLPLGPYIVAVSVVSPFIKFKNASKETIDASDELVEELRRALMQTGQRLSRYLKREHKADELEQRAQHIEQFGPILVETLARILEAPNDRKLRAEEGLAKILERDTKGIKKDLKEADDRLATYLDDKKQRLSGFFAGIEAEDKEKAVAKAKARAEKAREAARERGEELPEEDEGEELEANEDGDDAADADDGDGDVKTKKKAKKKGKSKGKAPAKAAAKDAAKEVAAPKTKTKRK